MEIKKTLEYEQVSAEETIRLLSTSMDGLRDSEAKSRIGKFGYNEVVEKKGILSLTCYRVTGVRCHGYLS